MLGNPAARAIAAAFALSAISQADLAHRWSFDLPTGAAPSGTAIPDTVGTATAVIVGNNAVSDGSALTLPGTTTGNQSPANISAYIDLPNGLISSKTDLTVEIWATPLSAKNWQRLFDFGRMGSLSSNVRGGNSVPQGEILPTATQAPNGASSSDNLALAIHRGTAANTQRLVARLDGAAEVGTNSAATLASGSRHHFVCTFSAGTSGGGRITWFLNGEQITTLDTNFRLADLEDVNNWLGRSMYSGDSNSHISYDEVRLYDHVLTAEEISANLEAGPDHIVGSPAVDPPAPDHRWIFTTQAASEAAPGITFADDIAEEILTLRGNGASLTGGAVVLPGSTTGNQPASIISAYLDLPNGIVTRTASASFEAWASPLSSKNWQRLFDFGRTATTHGDGAALGEILDTTAAPGNTVGFDNLSLTFNNGGNLNSQQLEGQQGGNPAQYSFSTAATVPGRIYHYVLVIEDTPTGCQVRWYRDAVLQNTMNFPFHLTDLDDVNNWIGRSMYSGDSNSHLLLDEFRIYRRVVTPAEIRASHEAGPDPAIGPPEPLVPAPLPSRRWDFNTAAGNAPTGTPFPDTAIGEIVTVRGQGATTNGTQVTLPSATTNGNQTAANISAYLELPDGIITSHPSFSIEAWATPLSSKNWQRLFDFGSSSLTSGPGAQPGEIIDSGTAPGNFTAYDNLFLSLNNAGALGSHRLEARRAGGSIITLNSDFSATTAAGTEQHHLLTVEDGRGAAGPSGSLVKWYRNGVLAGSIDLTYRIADLSDVNNWIGRSMWAGDSNSHLSLNELRLYDRALTAAEARSTFAGGPDATFPPPLVTDDEATLHPDQKAFLHVLANDGNSPLPDTLKIVTPPTTGTAEIRNGGILYSHSGAHDQPIRFTYRVGNISGTTADGQVTIHFSSSLRLPNRALAMPEAPPTSSWQLQDALPGLAFNEPIVLASPPGDSRRLFVGERLAKIQLVPDITAATPTQQLFLDLQQMVQNRTPVETIQNWSLGENGLLGMAFHPGFAENGRFFVAYTVRINNGAYYQRVSALTVDPHDPQVADPASEVILLQQQDDSFNHNGGDLHFGPDGYLYYAAGDEDNSPIGQRNSQKIDGDFFSGIFRIDVDKLPGNVEPNPHPAVPVGPDGKAHFSIPLDNPFVHTSLGGSWGGTYQGTAVTPLPAVRTEFWATGLRHVWRMSFDRATGDLWAGDVGQVTYEEINLIKKGADYGWAYREGAHNFNGVLGTAPATFSSIDPFYEYVHTGIAGGAAEFKGNSVCGGYVYRGTRYPDLIGAYIFCDSVSGHIWRMDTTTAEVTRIAGLPGEYGVFSSQGVDPSNGDLLFCAYNAGKILRLTTGDAPDSSFPATLGETGLFSDLATLSPAPGLLPYEPNLAFWSDHALKHRWFSLPDETSKMTWSKDGNWTFPTGSLWVKHFDLEMSRGDPATKKRIETRVLVKTADGAYGVSYRWNDAQTDALLVPDTGVEFDLPIDHHGTTHLQRWQIPARTSCITCHTAESGRVLSFTTRQLNRPATLHGHTGNQLDLLALHGYFENTPDPAASLERHIRPDETDYPLEQRARSYLAVNCAYCHQQGGTASGFWDGRPQLTLEATGLIHGSAIGNGGDPANQYLVPGDPAHSIVLNRMAAANGFTRMPPLATAELDDTNIQLITDWIRGELAQSPLYDAWRDQFFAPGDPDGDRADDPDGDGLDNYSEYLLGSSPTGGATWQADLTGNSLRFQRMARRYYEVETSTDLKRWQPWDLPDLKKTYLPTRSTVEIPLPGGPEPSRFFRFKVSEP